MNSSREHAVVGRTRAGVDAVVSRRGRSRRAAPNVVVVLLDDMGFAQLGPFGSDIDDADASTASRPRGCATTASTSPPCARRAGPSLLTGRNHHAVGMGFLCDLPTGFPGYTGRLPRSAATLARVLRDAGYNTMAVGKWHLTPRNDRTASGPVRHLAARRRASSATTGSCTATPTTGRRRS